MKTKKLLTLLVILVVLALILVVPVGAKKNNPTGLNAKFIRWQEKDNLIHIIVPNKDVGQAGMGDALVAEGQPLFFGFEYVGNLAGDDLSDVRNDPDYDFRLSVNNDAYVSLKGYFQDIYVAVPGSGAPWMWDHDADGLGDGDGDGTGDLSGEIQLFRYAHPGLSAGTYEFKFTIFNYGSESYTDVITVVVE